jgi:hypothetical protein
MHRRNPAADHRAAKDCGPAPKMEQGYAQAHAGNKHGDEQRQDCHGEIVARANARIIGEHRNEVSCPDAIARDDCNKAQPNYPRAPTCCLGAVKQANCDSARQEANDDRNHYEAPVVVNGQAGIDSERYGPYLRPGSESDKWSQRI